MDPHTYYYIAARGAIAPRGSHKAAMGQVPSFSHAMGSARIL